MPKQNKDSNFRTSIPEPRWQQVVSVIIVLLGLAFWLWFILAR